MGQVAPLLKELRQGELVGSLESLTATAAAAADDIRRLNSAILNEENTELLRQSVSTLTKTLKHIEGISGDVSSLTGDSSTRNSLRQLIQSLSRLLQD